MKTILMTLGALVMVAGVASALPAPPPQTCTDDIDCTEGGSTCGGYVCSWAAPAGHFCVPAGTAAKGSDGWCGSDSDCKCFGQGARCAAPHCTFTLLSDAPDMFGQMPADMTAPPATDMATQSTPDLSTPRDLSPTFDDHASITCDHDTECASAACGGQVCQWGPVVHQCVAAGTDAQGTDGWCNNDSQCKCQSQGATCNLTTLHCTTTLPSASKSGCDMSQVPVPATGLIALGLVAVALLARRRSRS